MAGFFSDVFLNLALTWTNYGKATIISFLSTICVPIFATCMIGDRIRVVDIVAIVMSFIGMILIVQPWNGDTDSDFKADMIGVMFALLCAITSGIAVVANKIMSDNLHFTIVNFYYMSSNCLLPTIWIFF